MKVCNFLYFVLAFDAFVVEKLKKAEQKCKNYREKSIILLSIFLHFETLVEIETLCTDCSSMNSWKDDSESKEAQIPMKRKFLDKVKKTAKNGIKCFIWMLMIGVVKGHKLGKTEKSKFSNSCLVSDQEKLRTSRKNFPGNHLVSFVWKLSSITISPLFNFFYFCVFFVNANLSWV